MALQLRSQRKPNQLNTNQTPTTMRNTYTLNIEKSLEKKLMAAKRVVNLSYEFTNGGIVIEADAATFELIKIATNNYYAGYPDEDCKAEITRTTDNGGKNIVQYTTKISKRHNHERLYTIKLYTTTSRMLVNGRKATKIFLKSMN